MNVNGLYITKHGSKIELSGNNGGISKISFDWFEEPDACIECVPDDYPTIDEPDVILTWNCEECEGGSARAYPSTPTKQRLKESINE